MVSPFLTVTVPDDPYQASRRHRHPQPAGQGGELAPGAIVQPDALRARRAALAPFRIARQLNGLDSLRPWTAADIIDQGGDFPAEVLGSGKVSAVPQDEQHRVG